MSGRRLIQIPLATGFSGGPGSTRSCGRPISVVAGDHAFPLRSSGPRCCSRPELRPPRRVGPRLVQWSGTKMSKTARPPSRSARRSIGHGADLRCATSCSRIGFDRRGDFTWERFDRAPTISELADNDRQPRVARAHDDREHRGGTVRATHATTTHRWRPRRGGAARGLTHAPWTRTACRRARRSSSRSRDAANRYVEEDGALQTREAGGEKLPSSTRCSRTWPAPSPGSPCWHNRSSPAMAETVWATLGRPLQAPWSASGCVIWIP